LLSTLRPHWAGQAALVERADDEQPLLGVILPPKFRASSKAIAAVASNARAAAGMGVPGVLEYVDVLRLADGRLGIGYRPVESEGVRSLREVIQRETPKVEFVVGVLRQVVHTLATLHEAGVRHGALTLDAVLVDRTGRAYVGDFGLSKLVGDTRHDDFDDALRPHTPERVLGLEDELEDAYSWALVGYRILTRTDPFAGGGFEEIRRRHAIEDVPALRSLNPGVPPELAAVIERCLVKEPGDRYTAMTTLERAFVQAQRSAGIKTPFDDLGLVDEDAEMSSRGMPPPTATRRAVDPPFTAEAARQRAQEDEARLAALVASTAAPAKPVPAPLERTAPPVSAIEAEHEAPSRALLFVGLGLAAVVLVGLGLWLTRGGTGVEGDEVATASKETPPLAKVAEATPRPRAERVEDPEPSAGETGEPDLVLDDPIALGPEGDTDGEPGVEDEDADIDDAGAAAEDSDASADELAKRAKAAARAGRTGTAISLYKQAIAKAPRDRESMAALGNIYFNRSDYRRASSYFGKAVAVAPGNANHRLSLGDAYYKLGRYKDAKKQYDKAKSLGSSAAQRRLDKVTAKLGAG